MRHLKSGRHFSRTAAHRKSMLETLATQLIEHESIQTTEAKAKELRGVVDRLITLAKRGDFHARRIAASRLHQPHIRRAVDRSIGRKASGEAIKEASISRNTILNKLFGVIAKRFADRKGGYTRIIKLSPRHGDNAPMVNISLLGEE